MTYLLSRPCPLEVTFFSYGTLVVVHLKENGHIARKFFPFILVVLKEKYGNEHQGICMKQMMIR